MSLKTQAKVLRVLQEQELERLGSNRVDQGGRPGDCRDQQDLEEEIDKGTFREDLFYRLNVVPIHVPALRERRETSPPWSGTSPTCWPARTISGARPSPAWRWRS